MVEQGTHKRLPASSLADRFLRQKAQEGNSPTTIAFYGKYLRKFLGCLPVLSTSPEAIRDFVDTRRCSPGGKHAYFRAIRAFYNWLEQEGLVATNPMRKVHGPKVPKKLMPALKPEELEALIAQAPNVRDKAIISLFADSGLRLRELASIRPEDIDWERQLVRVWVNGGKEALAPFGPKTKELLLQHLESYSPNGNVWGLKAWGISIMLRRLGERVGLKSNPHVFRRSFASALAQKGVDALHIMRLGRWETLAMVDRYTKSVKFEDSLKFYKPTV